MRNAHIRLHTVRLISLALACAFAAGGCLGPDAGPTKDAIYGMDGPMSPLPPPGKADSQNRRGLWVNTNTRATQVWDAVNAWEDTDTAAARKAGIAWGANSGLNWDQKYSLWVASLKKIPSEDSYYDTYMLTTPWGKKVPSPKLECAEMAMFLRITFAAWYKLPLFFEAVDQHGTRVFFSHNGIRTHNGRYASTPNFALDYHDYSGMSKAAIAASWPEDSTLRKRKLYGGEDDQTEIAEGAVFGTYLDEIHLNKRAGYFTALAINYLGSVNLADPSNAYNLVPEAVRPGDFVLHRWQKRGIGHTIIVKEVTDRSDGNKDVEVVSGSMPRRQGEWETGEAAKSYFTDPSAGGPGTDYDGDQYVKLGGGLKRFRVTKDIGGYWTNTFMNADEAHWINSTDYQTLAARTSKFEGMLGQVSPEQQRQELLAEIQGDRDHLSQFPASCAAREEREQAFKELYDLSARSFGETRAQVDAKYRKLEDYVFADLAYSASKTCCWDQSDSAMYNIIMSYAQNEQDQAAASGTCVKPTVFMYQSDGYQRWKDYAGQLNQADAWRPWTQDESCPQANVTVDTPAAQQATPYCQLDPSGAGAGGGGTCTDAYEPNDSQSQAKALSAGSYDGLKICDGDNDWFQITNGGTVTIQFQDSQGDLDMAAFNGAGQAIGSSTGSGDSETVTVPGGALVQVYGYQGATNTYSLTVQ